MRWHHREGDYCRDHLELGRCHVSGCNNWSLDDTAYCADHESCKFDKDGFDKYGFNKDGFDKEGFNKDRKHHIHLAAHDGDHKAVQAALDKDLPVDILSRDCEWTPLMYAADRGHLEVVKLLVLRKATVDKIDEEGDSALRLACKSRHISVAHFLLDNGPAAAIKQFSLFCTITCYHSKDTDRKDLNFGLDEHGFDKDGFHKDGEHRIHLAIQAIGGDFQAVQAELAKGVSPDIVTKNRLDWTDDQDACKYQNPLMHAAEHGDPGIFKLLVSHKATVDKTDNAGHTALHRACISCDGHIKVVQYLLGRRADVNKADNNGWTPLMWAAHCGRADWNGEQTPDRDRDNSAELRYRSGKRPAHIISLLLERKADPNVKSTAEVDSQLGFLRTGGVVKTGSTALHIAEQMRAQKTVRQLQFAMDINTTAGSSVGWTRLMRAVWNRETDVVEMLLECKADMTIKSTADTESIKKGSTALDIANEAKFDSIVALLIHNAASAGDLSTVRAELDKGVSVDIVTEGTRRARWTALMAATHSGQIEVVKLLVSRKATLDKIDNDGWTALFRACLNGHVNIAQFLLDNGADINKTDCEGWTPLMHAAYDGCENSVKLLLERKADVTSKSSADSDGGGTALQFAEERKHDKIVDLIQAAMNAHASQSSSQQQSDVKSEQPVGATLADSPSTDVPQLLICSEYVIRSVYYGHCSRQANTSACASQARRSPCRRKVVVQLWVRKRV